MSKPSISIFRIRMFVGVCLILGAIPEAATGAEAENALEFASRRKCVFGGQDVEFRMLVWGEEADLQESKVRGVLSVNRHTVEISRGEAWESKGKSFATDLTITIPPVKRDVVMTATLEVQLLSGPALDAIALSTRKLYVFHANPFADRRVWLDDLNIHVFDPAASTVESLRSCEIPFEQIHNRRRINSLADGMLIIGNNISLEKQRGLVEQLSLAANRGVAVLCLGFAEGNASLPGISGSPDAGLRQIQLHREDIVKLFDKRYDLPPWSDLPKDFGSSFSFIPHGPRVVAKFIGKGDGWLWYRSQRRGGAPLVICGLPLIEGWDSSPVPRYLLLKIFEELDDARHDNRPHSASIQHHSHRRPDLYNAGREQQISNPKKEEKM